MRAARRPRLAGRTGGLSRPCAGLLVGLALGLVSPALGQEGSAPEPARAPSLADTVDRVRPSIVAVGTFLVGRTPRALFLGTGFAVGDGRHVLTNAHVVPDAEGMKKNEQLAIFAGRGQESRKVRAEVVLRDDEHDLALLAFSDPDDEALPALRLGDSARVREGELYAFTGFPIGVVLGLYPVTHRGIISAITPIAIPAASLRELSAERLARLRDPYLVFQLDATAYPGNSGSPLYDVATGEVIGIVNRVFVKESRESVLEKPSGISYAIPSAFAEKLLTEAGVKPP